MDWAALAGGIASLGGALGSIGASANLNKKNRQWQSAQNSKQFMRQLELMQYQNDYNQRVMREEFEMNADYNSPQAQMQRYQDAGLNPNLIYSQANGGDVSAQLQPSVGLNNIEGNFDSPYKYQPDFNILANAGTQLANVIINEKTAQINNNAKRAETMFYYGVDPGSKVFDMSAPTFGGNKRETFNLSASALKHQVEKDNKQLALSEKQFQQTIREFGERIRQFNSEINFKEKQMRDSGRQFDRRLSHDIEVLKFQKENAHEQLEHAKEQLKLNKETQYYNTYQLRLYDNYRTGKGGFFQSIGDLGHFIGMGMFGKGVGGFIR